MRYEDAGVDINAGEEVVKAAKRIAASTQRPGAVGHIGGFAGLFDIKAAGFQDPLLVLATDGVGTKLKVAIETNRHSGIGIDLVAMSVNDLVVQGATPLAFLDYIATGRLDQAVIQEILGSIAAGCVEARCALVGGETAEMPGLYANADYDLAGFAVGAVEKDRLLPQDVEAGDAVLGLASNGVHANGFSLVRRIVEKEQLSWDAQAPFDASRSLADAFLTPTRIYVKSLLRLHEANLLHAAAHITGGGLIENLPRVIPPHLGARLDQPWKVHTEFDWLRRAGGIACEDMARTFNCGIGMALVVPESKAGGALELLRAEGETCFMLGQITEASDHSVSLPSDEWWL